MLSCADTSDGAKAIQAPPATDGAFAHFMLRSVLTELQRTGMRQIKTYLEAEQNPNFPAVEKSILEYWERERIFEASMEKRPRLVDGRSLEFVFYDGPPFANGLPHYGHLATGFVKELVPRYQTMRGRMSSAASAGIAMAGPAELEVERDRRHRPRRDPRSRHRRVQRQMPRVGATLHQGMGVVCHAAGPLGFIS